MTGMPRCRAPVANEYFHVEGVALLDHQVQSFEEVVDSGFVDAFCPGIDREIRVQFCDSLLSECCLVDSEVEDRGRETVEVGQVEVVEVRQTHIADDAFESEGMRDSTADAEPDDPDPKPRENELFLVGDLVAVAIQTQTAEPAGSEKMHQGAAPRVVNPARGFRDVVGIRLFVESEQRMLLVGKRIENHGSGRAQFGPHGASAPRRLRRRFPHAVALSRSLPRPGLCR